MFVENIICVVIFLLHNCYCVKIGEFTIDDSLWDNHDYDDPTEEEISRAVNYDYEYWGTRLIHEDSLRIICFGGSNTAIIKSYSNILSRYLLVNHTKDSYAINAGIAGAGACEANSMNLYLFDEIPRQFWPNVVILEFSLNCGMVLAIPCLDTLVNSIRTKYRSHRLPDPYFINLELFRQGQWTETYSKETVEDRLKEFGGSDIKDERFNRGCNCCIFNMQVSRFYGIPYISNTDALIPAFTRHHFNESDWKNPWKFYEDYAHLSAYGFEFVAFKLLLPFIFRAIDRAKQRASAPSRVDHPYTLYDHDVRMHPPSAYSSGVLREWTLWGSKVNLTQALPASITALMTAAPHHHHGEAGDGGGGGTFLKYSSLPKESWKVTSTKFKDPTDEGHNCYGGTQKDSLGLFHFVVPAECGHNKNCKLYMYYVHSWNVTHFGDTACSLYTIDPKSHSKTQEGSELLIIGHLDGSSEFKNTLPVMHQVLENNIVGGNYMLQCSVRIQDRLSCISSIFVYYS